MNAVCFAEDKFVYFRDVIGISKRSNYELMPRPILLKSVFECFKNIKDRVERIRGEY